MGIHTKEVYVICMQEFPLLVNVGEPPVTGIVSLGELKRHHECQDVKIKDPEHGLFFVVDGAPTGDGYFAAMKTAQTVTEILGSQIDVELTTIAHSQKQDTSRHNELMESLVMSEMHRAILEADQTLEMAAQLDEKKKHSTASIALAKLVLMPDHTHTLFYTNVGSTRLFLLRNRELTQMTDDDSFLTKEVLSGQITSEEAFQADQADTKDDVPHKAMFAYQHRNKLTRSVGALEEKEIQVKTELVFPGDRLVLTSHGLTDQLKQKIIQNRLNTIESDREAERVLQQEADDMAVRGTDPRAKADDISVIIQTI